MTPQKTSKKKFRWQILVDWVTKQIDSGGLKNGDILPSLRKLAEQFDVSLATAQRAVWQLEQLGVLQTIPRVGSMIVAKPSQEAAFNFSGLDVDVDMDVAAMLAKASLPSMVTLGSAVLDKSLSADPVLRRCLTSVAKNSDVISQFVPPPGDIRLRQVIAGQMVTRGVICAPDDIIITAGDTVALELSLTALGKPKGIVIVEDPTYFGILQAIEHTGMKALPVKTDPKTGIDTEVVAAALEQKGVAAIFLNPTLQNPRGFTMPREKREFLAELSQKHDVPIIEDDVFADLVEREHRVDAIKSFAAENVIYCSSFTKTIAPGFRVGWCIPGKYKSSILAQMFGRNLSVSSLPQAVLVDFFLKGYHKNHLETLRQNIATSANKFAHLVNEAFPKGTVYHPPAGGFVHWVELPNSIDLAEFHTEIERSGIVMAPARIFSLTGQYNSGLRFCLTSKMTPALVRNITRLGELAKKFDRNT
ncbi:PLP-dependent aminotransferase family protein [Epibacterium ulvae]|uniref:aminotransferase-like domain-containing protein n=1 Tax=Epibacterium ulvae TaxID=1156985 RepID=UPI0024905DEE|nr:PLP-dependent aminotransferase family protein [Epibacterium ulvae]